MAAAAWASLLGGTCQRPASHFGQLRNSRPSTGRRGRAKVNGQHRSPVTTIVSDHGNHRHLQSASLKKVCRERGLHICEIGGLVFAVLATMKCVHALNY